MLHVLPLPLPWYIVGPSMGLVIVGMYAVTNQHLGVSASYVQLVDVARRRPTEVWQLWFLAGLLLGGALAGVLGGNPQGFGYGRLGQLLSPAALVGVLFVGGTLIGYGSRWAGGCTSGHGLSGCSTRSTGSTVAICTFVVTAVGVTLGIHLATGGAL